MAENEKKKLRKTCNLGPLPLPDEVASITFGGGGFKSVAGFWPILHTISKKYSIEKLLDNVHIGSSSGGGWFASNLIYNRRFWKTLSTNMSRKDFEAEVLEFLNGIAKSMKSKAQDPGFVTRNALKLLVSNPLLKSTLESQGFPLFDDDMLDCFTYYLKTENGWKALNEDICHELSETPNTNVKLTWDQACSILTEAVLHKDQGNYCGSTVFYRQKNKTNVQIPCVLTSNIDSESVKVDFKLCQESERVTFETGSRSNMDGYYGCCHCQCGEDTKDTIISEKDMEKGVQNLINGNPKHLSGPSSCYFGCFNQSYFAEFLSIPSTLTNLLEYLEEDVLYDTYWRIKCGLKNTEISLADGGPWDHPGIVMAVRGMQRQNKTGTILAITLYTIEDYLNALFLWEGQPGESLGVCIDPYPCIFKGAPPQTMQEFGNRLQVVDCEVETIDCPNFGIKGGQKYRLYWILSNPYGMKLFPFTPEVIEQYQGFIKELCDDLENYEKTAINGARMSYFS